MSNPNSVYNELSESQGIVVTTPTPKRIPKIRRGEIGVLDEHSSSGIRPLLDTLRISLEERKRKHTQTKNLVTIEKILDLGLLRIFNPMMLE